MKARVPKAWDKLSHVDQEKLKAFTREVALEAAERQIEIDGGSCLIST